MSNFSLNTSFGVGDEIKLVFDLSNNFGSSPTVSLAITIGDNSQNIYTASSLAPQNNITVTHIITDANKSDPVINFTFTSSNAGDYTWGTNLEIFKKIEEVFVEIPDGQKKTLGWS